MDKIESKTEMTELPRNTRTIKVDIRTWNTLKKMKRENETFDEVIQSLLGQRSQSLDNGTMQAIKYSRKTAFFVFNISWKTKKFYMTHELGVEIEYNDIKGHKENFTIDLKIKKIFYEKSSYNPSIFFGVDQDHKHLVKVYLDIYLKCIYYVLKKELSINSLQIELLNNIYSIIIWRKIYYDSELSQDSFQSDIEEPLKLSVEEKLTPEYTRSIEESIHYNIQ